MVPVYEKVKVGYSYIKSTSETTGSGRIRKLTDYYEGEKGPYYVSNTSVGIISILDLPKTSFGLPSGSFAGEEISSELYTYKGIRREWPVKMEKEFSESVEFEEAIKFFEANKEEFLEEYENKFIAIINNKIVDFDEDFSALAERVFGKYGYKDVYIPKVTRETQVFKIPTPFLRK